MIFYKKYFWIQWIGKYVHIGIPATPLNFFFWGCIKNRIFASLNTDFEKEGKAWFKAPILGALARVQTSVCTVTEGMLKITWRELKYHLDNLRPIKGIQVGIG